MNYPNSYPKPYVTFYLRLFLRKGTMALSWSTLDQSTKNQKSSTLNLNPSINNNTNKKQTSPERKGKTGDRYDHRTSYPTYVRMGSFRCTQGKDIWRREVPSKHTNSAILLYNNMFQWTAHTVRQRRQGSNEH